jgi:hypothetical protein
LQGEVATSAESTVIILRDPPGFSLSTDRTERFAPLELDPQVHELLDETKVFEASRIIKKGDTSQTNFERTILRSIHWFANAQTPMLSEYVLLSLMFSIEAFLNPPGSHEEVTKAITEGVAALEGVQGYIYRKKRMAKLYEKRSALSHGDHTDIMERDITELRAIAYFLIHKMLQCTNEFTTQKQLFEAAKEKRENIEQQIARNHPSI